MGLFRVLLLLGFVIKFWWAILAVLAVVALGFLAYVRVMHHAAELGRGRRKDAAIVARADQQHAWVLAGDERGVYGNYALHLYHG
jgi:hypothetical protein